MLEALIQSANRLLARLRGEGWLAAATPSQKEPAGLPAARPYERLQRVLLTDEVSRTLFEEYAAHRAGKRGDEEIGWILLGLREPRQAVVLATLPAGARRRAGVAHVHFNAEAQAVASRIVRQWDRRLVPLGVVHTHPGSLRHPSDGDLDGDREWITQLRGGEGVFGIGTADAPEATAGIAHQPSAHVQCFAASRFSWYALAQGDRGYRPVEVALTLGPDLARPLHPVWSTIEAHAGSLDRLGRQQAGIRFEVIEGPGEPGLGMSIRLAEAAGSLRVELHEHEKRYYVIRGSNVYKVEPKENRLDRSVYLLLAELAGRSDAD